MAAEANMTSDDASLLLLGFWDSEFIVCRAEVQRSRI